MPLETREDHHRRHRCGEGRRRLAFRPLHAPRRDGVLQGRGRSDRQGQADGRGRAGHDAGEIEFADGRFASRGTNRTFDFLELAKEAARHTLPERLKDGLAVVTDNEMHEPVFPNGCAICEVEVDPETGARRDHPLRLGRRRRPLHQSADRARPDPRRDRAGRRPGDVGAVLRRSRLRPAAGRLVDGLRHAARRRPAVVPTEIAEVLSPTNPLGIKAGGEGGTTAAPAVIISAIVDALRRTACATSRCRRRRTRSGERSRTPRRSAAGNPIKPCRSESLLREKLRKIEALFAGGATVGERSAAAAAAERIRARLEAAARSEQPTEIRFSINDTWSRQLFLALCRRYGIRPYRYPRMQRQTLVVRAPRSFVDTVLWPEFQEINAALVEYLSSLTERVIREEVDGDIGEAEEIMPVKLIR